ncbi:hypothetical protein V494_04595 [Pseudogymnoascus sp. VKM F-4513 (FW-928)]|nr:hypothetical protein V494_04595 [Pseudogymnoascus sp. VKM F-4513 (FW-928)]
MAHTDEKKDLEAGSRLSGIDIDEKAGLRNSAVQNQGSARSTRLKVPEFIRSSTSTMPSFRHFLIYLTIFAVFAVTFTSAATVRVRNHHAPTEDEIQFKKLLATISDPALHDALEQYISSRYHPGAGGQENTVVQVDNAAVATSLAELVRRQSTNGTTTTTTTSITDPPDTTSSIVEPPTTSDAPPVSTRRAHLCLTLSIEPFTLIFPFNTLSNHHS